LREASLFRAAKLSVLPLELDSSISLFSSLQTLIRNCGFLQWPVVLYPCFYILRWAVFKRKIHVLDIVPMITSEQRVFLGTVPATNLQEGLGFHRIFMQISLILCELLDINLFVLTRCIYQSQSWVLITSWILNV